jgi:hypothetical protein
VLPRESGDELEPETFPPPSGDRPGFVTFAMANAAAITAVTCQSYNSYQGLLAQGELREFSWAPVLAAWGKNNRSAMLRLPGNRHCVENRAVDMSTNLYLAAALASPPASTASSRNSTWRSPERRSL